MTAFAIIEIFMAYHVRNYHSVDTKQATNISQTAKPNLTKNQFPISSSYKVNNNVSTVINIFFYVKEGQSYQLIAIDMYVM